jgi:hypothetical protein
MTPFDAALDSWHDFYIAVGSASAALLGLLFVGVSISISSLPPRERRDVTTRANLAFSNLLYLLGLSLIVLMPNSDPTTIAISFAVIAGLGLLRIARRARGLRFRTGRRRLEWETIRKVGWTVAADLLILWIAWRIALTSDASWLLATPIIVLILLVGAADVAWDLLVRESGAASA